MPLKEEQENKLLRHLSIYLNGDTKIRVITDIITFVNTLIDENENH